MEHYSLLESSLLGLRRVFPKGLGTAIFGSLALRAIGAALAFLVGIQLARYLGVEGYGTYALCMTAVSLIATFSQFGLAPLAVREIAKFPGSLTMRYQILWFLRRAAYAVIIICILSSLYIEYRSEGSQLRDNSLLYTALFLAVVSNVTQIMGAILRGAQLVLKGQISEIVVKPALFSLLLLAAWSSSLKMSPKDALVLQLLAAIAALALAAFFTNRLFLKATTSEKEYWATDSIAAAALPIWMSDIIRAVNSSYPLIALAIFFSAEGVGIYKVAMSCAAILSLPSAIFNVAAGPYLARIHATGDPKALQRLHSGIGCVLFGMMIVVTGTIWLFGADLIVLAFGEPFREAAAPLLILSLCQLVIAFFGISATFMIMAGGQKYVFYSFSISVSIAIIASTKLIPMYGVTGVAYAELLMVLTWHMIIWNFCRLKYGYELSVFGLVIFGNNFPGNRNSEK